MKTNRLFSSALVFVTLCSLMVLASSCAVEGCTDPASDNYNIEATEDDGSCIAAREKFIAQYTVAESCPSGNGTYEVNIVPGASADNAVIINNLGGSGSAVSGTVDKASVTIPSQNITIQGIAISINGSGSINGNLLIINYSYNFAGGGETCSMNCTKR